MALLEAVISGGQTGADQAGLLAAQHLDINTGGYAPKGWKTEVGPAPWLGVVCGLIESEEPWYETRTEQNVKLADATVIFGRRSQGSNLTERLCQRYHKPFIWVAYPKEVEHVMGVVKPLQLRLWLARNQVKYLNVAGNRESKNPGVGEFTKQFLIKALHVR